MVVLIRELANISFSSSTKTFLPNKIVQSLFSMNIDINMTILKGRSLSYLCNSSRDSSMLFKASLVSYYKRMEIQSSNTL